MSRSRNHHDALSSGIGSLSMSSREDSTGGGGGEAAYTRHIEKMPVHQIHPAALQDNRHHRRQPQPPPSGSSGVASSTEYVPRGGGGGGHPLSPTGGGGHGNYRHHHTQQQQMMSGGGGKQQHSTSSDRYHHHHSNQMSHYNGVTKQPPIPSSLPPDVHLEPTSPTAGGPLDPFPESPPPPTSTHQAHPSSSSNFHHHHHPHPHHHQQQQQQHHHNNSTLECTRPAQGFSEKFESLRSECRRQGILYSDANFPATDSSLFFSRQSTIPITWMRPAEIARQYNMAPEFRAVAHNRGCDLKQGDLGDCWLVDSISCLLVHDCERHQLFHRVVPPGQSFSSSWYAGLFCFRFWRCGSWQEVIIDDLLPTRNGRAIFVHSEKVNEFWGALLEKAYAKLNGCYESLKGGLIGDAMTDITGGLTELYSLEYSSSMSILPPKDIDDVLIKAFDRHSLVGAGISDRKGSAVGSTNQVLLNGLLAGHAYTLTDTRKIRLKDEGGERLVTLVRLRNPWSSGEAGSGVEWTGAWCERSAEWRSIPQQDKINVGLVKGEGEFWMSLEDFLSNFDTLYLCHLPPLLSPVTVRLWTIHDFLGCWSRGVTAGGRPYLRHLHWTNPQYRLVLGGPDPGDSSGQCSFLVGLMQREKCSPGRHRPPPLVSIGFIIYKLPPKASCPIPRQFFERTNWLVSVDYFVNAREVVKRFRLPPGTYVLVPCTYDPDQEASFLLRIFFEHGACTADYPEGRLESFLPAQPSSTSIDLLTGGGGGVAGGSQDAGATRIGSGWFTRYFTAEEKAAMTTTGGAAFTLDAFQLQRLLNLILREEQQFYAEISVDACKSLVSLLDVELTFRVSESDLVRLWPYLALWIRIFRQVDGDRSGSIPIIELRNSFNNLGYYVPPKLVMRLAHRYADPNYRITFSSFVSVMALLKKVFDSFKKHDSTGKVVLSLEEYFEVALLL